MKKSFLDKFVGYLSPQAGLKRTQAKIVSETIEKRLSSRFYDGATSGRRTDGWITPSTSSSAETYGQLTRLRDRSRDLYRNDAFAKRAVDVVVGNTIGSGIVLKIEAKAMGRAKAAQEAWKKWAYSKECDAEGRRDFFALQSLIMNTVVQSGECLIRKINVSESKSGVNLKLQVLEPDHLDNLKDGYFNEGSKNRVIQGVEFDSQGQRVAYHVYENHPGDNSAISKNTYISKRIPASEMIHVFKQDRPGQVRGVPWFHACIITMQDLNEFIDATIVKQKVAAAFAGFVTDVEGQDAAGNFNFSDKMEPGAIELLPPGRDIKFPNPPGANDFDPLVKTFLRQIAAGLGITYEALSNDYSQVNFSSGRMGWIEFQRNIDQWRWNTIIPQFCDQSFEWFLKSAVISGEIDNTEGLSALWTPPKREMIDPASELKAMSTAMRSGLISFSEAHRSLGNDPDQVLKEMHEDNEKIDKFNLVLDSDPRKVSQSGQFQSTGSQVPMDDSSEETEDDEEELLESEERFFTDKNNKVWKLTKNGFEEI